MEKPIAHERRPWYRESQKNNFLVRVNRDFTIEVVNHASESDVTFVQVILKGKLDSYSCAILLKLRY